MPDVKLQVAMEDIKAVLRKHDVAGLVFLGSQSHSEFLYHLSASWSCARVEPGGFLRIRAKLVDFPSKAVQKKCIEDTLGVVMGFADLSRSAVKNLDGIAGMVGGHMDVSHWSRYENPNIDRAS